MFGQNALFGLTLVLAMVMYLRNVVLKELGEDFEKKTKAIQYDGIPELGWRLISNKKKLDKLSGGMPISEGIKHKLTRDLRPTELESAQERTFHAAIAPFLFSDAERRDNLYENLMVALRQDPGSDLVGIGEILKQQMLIHAIDLIVVVIAAMIGAGYFRSESYVWACALQDAAFLDAASWVMVCWVSLIILTLLGISILYFNAGPFDRRSLARIRQASLAYLKGTVEHARVIAKTLKKIPGCLIKGLNRVLAAVAMAAATGFVFYLPKILGYFGDCTPAGCEVYGKSALMPPDPGLPMLDILLSVMLLALVVGFLLFHLFAYDGKRIARYFTWRANLNEILK